MSSSRSGKKSTGSRKKRRAAIESVKKYLFAVLAIVLIGVACSGVYWGVQKGIEQIGSVPTGGTSKGGQAEVARPNPWPLPAGTPEADFYGTHPEAIEPANRATQDLPLRRRKTDPLVTLTNARIEEWHHPGESPEILAMRPKDITIQKVLRVDVIPVEWDNPPDNLKILHGASDNIPTGVTLTSNQLKDMKVGQVTTVEIHFPNQRPNLQIYAVTSDDRYRTVVRSSKSQPLTFKVSATIFLGTPFAGHAPREWLPEERTLLTTLGGEIP